MKKVYLGENHHALFILQSGDGPAETGTYEGPNERIKFAFTCLEALIWKLGVDTETDGVDAFIDTAGAMIKSTGMEPMELVAAYKAHQESLTDNEVDHA